jgi:hypothetical protein
VIKFLINAVFVLFFVFIIVLLLSLMSWVLLKLLRFLFPGRFAPASSRKEDVV